MGAALAFHSIAARHLQSVAADGLLPRWLAREHGSQKTALSASLTVTMTSLGAVFAMAAGGVDRLVSVFVLFSHVGALSSVLMFVLVFFGIATYFLRGESGSDGFFGWEGALIATLTGGVTLGLLLVLATAETDRRLGVASGSALTWIVPGLAGAAFVAGVLRAQHVRHRWRETPTGLVSPERRRSAFSYPRPKAPDRSADVFGSRR